MVFYGVSFTCGLITLYSLVRTNYTLFSCIISVNTLLSCVGGSYVGWNKANGEAYKEYAKEIDVLKEKVRATLTTGGETSKPIKIMNLINILERLGVSNHFEKEIEDHIQHIFPNFEDDDDEDYDSFSVALCFRLFRQHGYKMSCDAFNKFKDNDSKFKEAIKSDVKGLLSFYEATHLRMRGEDIMEEAFLFTSSHLKTHLTSGRINLVLAKQVENALKLPLHKNFTRVAARDYIPLYQEDELLLKFAKLDFNLVHMLHKQELSVVLRWWKELDLKSKLPYLRERVVETYFWTMGIYFEPRWSRARIMLTKSIVILAAVDETHDSYGTLEELTTFRDAVKRWDMSMINQLPDYMKPLYEALLSLYEEFAEELRPEGRSYAAHHTQERMAEMAIAYFDEAVRLAREEVLPFEEYMENAIITGGYYMATMASFMGMGEIASRGAFEWLLTKPKIIVSVSEIARYLNDIVTFEVEKGIGQKMTGIECYMNEYGVSKQEAMDEFRRRTEEAMKIINEEIIKLSVPISSVSLYLLLRILNLARMMFVTYDYEDGYTYPDRVIQNQIHAMFGDQLKI